MIRIKIDSKTKKRATIKEIINWSRGIQGDAKQLTAKISLLFFLTSKTIGHGHPSVIEEKEAKMYSNTKIKDFFQLYNRSI